MDKHLIRPDQYERVLIRYVAGISWPHYKVVCSGSYEGYWTVSGGETAVVYLSFSRSLPLMMGGMLLLERSM